MCVCVYFFFAGAAVHAGTPSRFGWTSATRRTTSLCSACCTSLRRSSTSRSCSGWRQAASKGTGVFRFLEFRGRRKVFYSVFSVVEVILVVGGGVVVSDHCCWWCSYFDVKPLCV